MRILNIIQCTNLGGMEQASLRLMKALQSRGHEIQLISLNPVGDLGQSLDLAGIPAFGLNYSGQGRLPALMQLRRALKEVDADGLILTGHNLAATLALGKLCEGRRLMAVHYHHEGVMPNWQWRVLYQVAKRQFQTITFPSDYVRAEAEALYPPIAELSMTVRNPLRLPLVGRRTTLSFRRELAVPDDAPLIGNAGWLIERKRFDIFLRTAAELVRIIPDAHFVIAGDGPQRDVLQSLAARLGIADKVHWIGWQSDLSLFYCSIDAMLFNSDWDCFPTTPVEAMAFEKPVVASVEHGGLREILGDETGWLIDRHDVRWLASALVDALGTAGKRRAANARRRVGDMSDPAAIALLIEQRLFGGFK